MARKKRCDMLQASEPIQRCSKPAGNLKMPLENINTMSKQMVNDKESNIANLMNIVENRSDTGNALSGESEVEVLDVAGAAPASYATWLSSQRVDNNVVESILSTLNNLVSQERVCKVSQSHQDDSDTQFDCIQIDSDDDIENCHPAALNQATSETSGCEVMGSNESYFNSTINSTEASFCMMNGTSEEILLCFQFLIREVFLAFRRSSDSNLVLRDKKMPDYLWATEFLIRIRGNHFYTLTNLSCTLSGDMFDLKQIADIMKNHREVCKGAFRSPKLNHKWSTVQKLAQFIPIVLCAQCREKNLEDDTIRTLFEIFDSLPEGICTSFTKYSSSNKTMQKKLSEQTESETSETSDDLIKRTNRYRLILRDIFFDVPRSSDCNNVLNNTTSFIRNDNFRNNMLKKLRRSHYCTTENMTVHLSDSEFLLGYVPELSLKHDSECQGSIQFPNNFGELSLLDKLVCLLPLLLCQDCNRSVLTDEQLTILDEACVQFKYSRSQKGIVLTSRTKDLNKRPSDTPRETSSDDPKKRFKKTL